MVVDGSWWLLCLSDFPSSLAWTAFFWTPLLMKVYLSATSFWYLSLHSSVCNDKVVVKTVECGTLSPPLISSSGLSFTFACSAITTRPSSAGSFSPLSPPRPSLPDLFVSPFWCSRQTSAAQHEEPRGTRRSGEGIFSPQAEISLWSLSGSRMSQIYFSF